MNEKKDSEIKINFIPDNKMLVQYNVDDIKNHRQIEVNELIEMMKSPLEKEQNNKINYRKNVLISYLIFFVLVTIAIFIFLFLFWKDGFNQQEAEVSQILIGGFFVNLISLAVVVFKYLFDDKNSLMKDLIQLIVETLKEK
ncbi:hypothetical protein [Leuconostoc mesenteroides]|uniref:hypothetical protein n=1 Tax=Leuconostoc mesenteroides TaxID=1245 RepID=UPI001239E2AD|nr:hypothetical protein [Leuconostoc mesenteroides]KAA8347282.1 hypothetical protein FE418_07285 [Leuconostoc mesenteroides]